VPGCGDSETPDAVVADVMELEAALNTLL